MNLRIFLTLALALHLLLMAPAAPAPLPRKAMTVATESPAGEYLLEWGSADQVWCTWLHADGTVDFTWKDQRVWGRWQFTRGGLHFREWRGREDQSARPYLEYTLKKEMCGNWLLRRPHAALRRRE